MDQRFKVTPVPGAVSIPFSEDFKIEVSFLDSRTQQVLVDHTGANAVLMSTLLTSMSQEVLEAFVREVAPRMVAIASGMPA